MCIYIYIYIYIVIVIYHRSRAPPRGRAALVLGPACAVRAHVAPSEERATSRPAEPELESTWRELSQPAVFLFARDLRRTFLDQGLRWSGKTLQGGSSTRTRGATCSSWSPSRSSTHATSTRLGTLTCMYTHMCSLCQLMVMWLHSIVPICNLLHIPRAKVRAGGRRLRRPPGRRRGPCLGARCRRRKGSGPAPPPCRRTLAPRGTSWR